MEQMVQCYKSTLIQFPRFPKFFGTERHSCTLVVTADASSSIVIMAFLVVFNKDGIAKVNLIQSKTFLAANVSTIPQHEFHALALASQFCRQLVTELAHLLQNFIVCTDAKICIYWCLSDCKVPKTIFVENRTQMIKSCLETSIDLLMENQAERGGGS